jgi:hypothetical protein
MFLNGFKKKHGRASIAGRVLTCELAPAWDRRRLACTKREARKASDAGETPAVPGRSIRELGRHHLAGVLRWGLEFVVLCVMRKSHFIFKENLIGSRRSNTGGGHDYR